MEMTDRVWLRAVLLDALCKAEEHIEGLNSNPAAAPVGYNTLIHDAVRIGACAGDLLASLQPGVQEDVKRRMDEAAQAGADPILVLLDAAFAERHD